jgi:DNA gyrase subunit A
MEVMQPGDTILTVTQRGFGKRTKARQYPRHHRGGQGVRGLNITDKNGPVLCLLQLSAEDQIMLVTDRGKILRMAVKGIPLVGRVTQGVKLMDAEPEEQVVSVAKVVERGDDGESDPGDA